MKILNLKKSTTGLLDLFWIEGKPLDPELQRVYASKFSGGRWLFPAFSPFFEWVLDDLKVLYEDSLILSKDTDLFINRLRAKHSLVEKSHLWGFEPRFPPYAHQAQGLSRVILQPRCAIFWDPGLGKTKLMCDRILYERQRNPQALTLILALRVNLSTWVREMNIHSAGEEEIIPLVATGPAQRKKRLEKALEKNPAGIVVTYDTARVALPLLLDLPNKSIIVADESHKMQSYKSGLTLAALALSEKFTYRYILSGTPTKGKPTDLWASLRFLGKFLVPKYWDFDSRYVIRAHYNRHIVTGYKGLDDLNNLVDCIADVRKSEDTIDLPDRTFQKVYVGCSPRIKRHYNQVARNPLVNIEGEEIRVENLLTKLGKLAQLSSGFIYKSLKDPELCDDCPHMANCVENNIKPYTNKCKIETINPGNITVKIPGPNPVVDSTIELMSSHVTNNKKVIIWAKHRETLESLYTKACEELDRQHVLRYDSTIEDLGETESQFNTDPEKKVIIAQITMGIGITLKAPIMIYTELSFNLADWLQSLDRNWGIRAAGLGNILVQIVMIPNSIYDQTYTLLQNKIDVASLIKDRPNCSICAKILDCVAKGVKPFDRECILDKAVTSQKVLIKEIT